MNGQRIAELYIHYVHNIALPLWQNSRFLSPTQLQANLALFILQVYSWSAEDWLRHAFHDVGAVRHISQKTSNKTHGAHIHSTVVKHRCDRDLILERLEHFRSSRTSWRLFVISIVHFVPCARRKLRYCVYIITWWILYFNKWSEMILQNSLVVYYFCNS